MSIARSLRANWGLGLVALGISFVLWTIIVTEQNPPLTGAYNNLIRVEPVSVPPNLDVLKELEPVVVRITAPLDVWKQISMDTFRATVDLTGLGSGEHQVPVHVESRDRRVQVNEVLPGMVKVELDTLLRQAIPVKVNVQQGPPFGYSAGEPRTAVAQAAIIGPEQLVSSVDAVVADVNLSTSRTDLRQTVRLVPRTTRGYEVTGVTVEPASVLVEVPVKREVNFQAMAVVAEVVSSPPPGFWLSRVVVRPTAVTVVGPADVLQPLGFLKTQPVDITGLTAPAVRQVPVALPEGVSVVGQSTIEVELTVSPVRGSVQLRVAPRLEGLASGRQVVNETLSLTVTVSGEGPALLDLTPDRVTATLDLRGLEAGTHRLEPRVQVPPSLKVESVTPQQVAITLR
ncbi:MAG: hypothetical protein HY689_03825 [Chloroflexi bacterium]|nr:hypothetical protein [Chloroflexota bacterium]